MLKGIKGGVLITINSKKDIKEFQNKLKNKKFFNEEIDFLLKKKDNKYFKELWDIADKYNHNLYIIKEVEKIKTVPEKNSKTKKVQMENKKLKEEIEEKNANNQGERVKIIERTLRSGQRVVSSGHIIIIGSVNPGAEVVADGDIYVWGKVRGLLHAGANGNKKSKILALSLDVKQVRIADVFAKKGKATITDTIEMAFLDEDDNLILEEFEG
ncbi:MAG: septum site-determining protein MinC [Fusobacteriota bacterium]